MSLRFPNWTTMQFAALEIASGRCLNNIHSSEEIQFIENTLILWGWKRSQNIPVKQPFQRICSEFLFYSQINCGCMINPTYSLQNCLQNVSNLTPFRGLWTVCKVYQILLWHKNRRCCLVRILWIWYQVFILLRTIDIDVDSPRILDYLAIPQAIIG